MRFSNTPKNRMTLLFRIFADIGGSPSSSPLVQFSLGDLGRVDTGIVSFRFRGLRLLNFFAIAPCHCSEAQHTGYQ